MSSQVDSAISDFCNSYPNAPECGCFQFPVRVADQCSAQAEAGRDCVQHGNDCSGKQFLRYGDGIETRGLDGQYTESQFVVISFDQCVPYWCWNAQCWENSLLTGEILQGQLSCVNGICITVRGTDTITTNDLSIANASAFEPGGVMTKCDEAAKTAQPSFAPTLIQAPVDLIQAIPFKLVNSGQSTLNLKLESVTQNVIGVQTESIQRLLVSVNSFFTSVLPVNTYTLMQAYEGAVSRAGGTNLSIPVRPCPESDPNCTLPDGTLTSPRFWYSYITNGVQETFTFAPQLTLQPPSYQPQPRKPTVKVNTIPVWLWGSVGVAAVLFLLCVGLVVAARASAKQVGKLVLSPVQRAYL